MSPQHLLAVLRRRWVTVVVAVVVALVAAAAASLTATPRYSASSEVFVAAGGSASAGELAQLNIFTQERIRSYAELATTPLVLDPVVEQLGLDRTGEQLATQVEVTASPDTVLMTVTVTDTDPAVAARVADAVVEELAVVVPQVEPAQADGSPSISIVTASTASTPTAPSSPDLVLNLALAAVLGLLVGVAVAVLRGPGGRRTILEES